MGITMYLMWLTGFIACMAAPPMQQIDLTLFLRAVAWPMVLAATYAPLAVGA